MKFKKYLRGLVSYIPILKLILRKKGTGGSNNAEYCINSYDNHINKLVNAGMEFPPKTIGEVGPGDSLGIGITALLTGSSKYIALDSIPHASEKNNLSVLKRIIEILKRMNDERRNQANFDFIRKFINLDENKINSIQNSILTISESSEPLSYKVPWWHKENISTNSLDLILSNAVMEHVLELKSSYSSMFNWLKPGGFGSHVIDYRAHELSDVWYKHWEFSEATWNILMHGRNYPINRMPHSYHRLLLKEVGFEIIDEKTNIEKTGANIKNINPQIKKYFHIDDLNISTGHFIIKKPNK